MSNSVVLGDNISYCFLFRFMDTVLNCLARISMPSMFDFPRGSNFLNTPIICIIYKIKWKQKECYNLARPCTRSGIQILNVGMDCTFSSCLQKPSKLQKINISETSKGLFPGFSIDWVLVFWKQDWYSRYKQIQSCHKWKRNILMWQIQPSFTKE